MFNNTNRKSRAYAGFTLVELVVVLGVVLLLAAIAVPMVQGYLEDGREARARAEIKSFAASITSFYKDVGVYPTYNSAGKQNVRVICTGPKPTKNPFSNNSAWNSWLTSGYGDTLDNHLLANKPGGKKNGYATTGERRWKGPYVADKTPTDPWGRPYVAMIYSTHSTHKTNWKKMIFLSAGPNGQIDTSSNCRIDTEVSGDDIGMVISTRK